MDRQAAGMGKDPLTIASMKQGGVDRGLVRQIVRAFATHKEMSYEVAHQILSERAKKLGPRPERCPDHLLTARQRQQREKMAGIVARGRVLRGHFEGNDRMPAPTLDADLDGKGETPDLDEHALARSQRGGG